MIYIEQILIQNGFKESSNLKEMTDFKNKQKFNTFTLQTSKIPTIYLKKYVNKGRVKKQERVALQERKEAIFLQEIASFRKIRIWSNNK